MDDTKQLLVYGAFPALTALGFFSTMGSSWQNGLFASLSKIASGRVQDMPMTKARVIRQWTGIKPIDDYFAFYLAFFLPALGRGSPNSSIAGRHFIGQFTAMWALIQLQASKQESSALIQASMFATAFGIQTIGAATIVPIFCALHLATMSGEVGLVNPGRVAAVPLSVVMSILLPLMTASSAPSPWLRQLSINVFQVFYIFTEIIERSAAPAFSQAIKAGTITNPLGMVYSFAIGLAAVTHIGTIGAAIAAKIVPNLFPKGWAEQVSFRKMYWPRFALEKKEDMFEARLHFLRWDEFVSCTSFFLWATYLYLSKSPTTTEGFMILARNVLVRIALTGPIGAAAYLLRLRDGV